MRSTEAVVEARRAMQICNACRYCEGYCAVFPAMERRRDFTNADLAYFANLCHGCRGCYYACQYAPPHEFGINLPRTFQELRAESYEEYAWPAPLARLFRRNGLIISLAVALGVAAVLALTMLLQAPQTVFGTHRGAGAFYAVIPYEAMVGLGTLTFGFALLALVMGFRNFWRDTGGRANELVRPRPLARALGDVLTLRHLGGGGDGCNYPDESFSQGRRWLHHLMFYGFLLCFAATAVATVYDHGFGWIAPYGYTSAPVLLGTVGGVGLLAGTGGLIWLKMLSDPAPAARQLLGMDVAFLALLFLTSLTGLALLALRATPAMGALLAVHLGFVLALFVVLPYSKFVHGIYRAGALLRHALEATEPTYPSPPSASKPSARSKAS